MYSLILEQLYHIIELFVDVVVDVVMQLDIAVWSCRYSLLTMLHHYSCNITQPWKHSNDVWQGIQITLLAL